MLGCILAGRWEREGLPEVALKVLACVRRASGCVCGWGWVGLVGGGWGAGRCRALRAVLCNHSGFRDEHLRRCCLLLLLLQGPAVGAFPAERKLTDSWWVACILLLQA
jgi:hypothetical protein